MNRNQYQDFLASRIFKSNAYGSTAALLQALRAAAEIPEGEWRNRKAAFNRIGELAPMNDDSGFCLQYQEVAAFMAREADQFSIFSNLLADQPADARATKVEKLLSPAGSASYSITNDGKEYRDADVYVIDGKSEWLVTASLEKSSGQIQFAEPRFAETKVSDFRKPGEVEVPAEVLSEFKRVQSDVENLLRHEASAAKAA